MGIMAEHAAQTEAVIKYGRDQLRKSKQVVEFLEFGRNLLRMYGPQGTDPESFSVVINIIKKGSLEELGTRFEQEAFANYQRPEWARTDRINVILSSMQTKKTTLAQAKEGGASRALFETNWVFWQGGNYNDR